MTAPVAASTTGTAVVAGAGFVDYHANSFASLAYGNPNLKPEWKSTQNQQAVIFASRMIGGAAGDFTKFNSLWTDNLSGRYKGAVVRGDSSTSQENYLNTDPATAYGTLRYGATAAPVANAAAVPTLAGVFAKAVLADATGDGLIAGTSFTTTIVSGSFSKGMIGSANN